MADSQNELLLDIDQISVHFNVQKDNAWPWEAPASLTAVDRASFSVRAGETIGIVGESGCGKSTLARAIIGLVPTSNGSIAWLGKDIAKFTEAQRGKARRQMQMIFQDPLASLNPRMTVGNIIGEPLRTFHPELPKERVLEQVRKVMEKVGLLSNQINRYPHEFSGGQCQRIGIARALIIKPEIVICDEPVSALDVSIQAQVINLLKELQQEMGLSLIFIAHDLSVVKHISDRVLVMYLGNVVEFGDTDDLFDNPKHPYTRALMSAVPIPDPDIERGKTVELLEGDLPSPLNPPSGCVFRTRCPQSDEQCAGRKPVLRGDGSHQVACIQVGVEPN